MRRFGRIGRWFHAGIYLTVLVALATGWWFVLDGYRHDSPLASATGVKDGEIHEWAGYGAAGVFVFWLPFGFRGIGAFLRELVRFRRGDGRWLAGWPKAAFTGKFGHHDGHLDPGQRLATMVIVLALAMVVLSGLGMLLLPPAPLDLFLIHRWSTFVLTPVLLGHIVVASGVLPGYRGVWRAIHLGGRLRVEVAQRLWPAWLEREEDPVVRLEKLHRLYEAGAMTDDEYQAQKARILGS